MKEFHKRKIRPKKFIFQILGFEDMFVPLYSIYKLNQRKHYESKNNLLGIYSNSLLQREPKNTRLVAFESKPIDLLAVTVSELS